MQTLPISLTAVRGLKFTCGVLVEITVQSRYCNESSWNTVFAMLLMLRVIVSTSDKCTFGAPFNVCTFDCIIRCTVCLCAQFMTS